MNGIWRSAFGLVRADLDDRAAGLAGGLVDAVFAAAKYWLTMSFGR